MKLLHAFVTCSAFFACASTALAVPQVPPPPPIELVDLGPWTREWPSSASTLGIGRAVCGDFSGDLTPDVWQQTSGSLVLFLDPSYMEFTAELAVTTSSIARVPGGATRAKSRLAFAGPAGLELVEYTPDDANPFAITAIAVPSNASSWVDAKSLECEDLNFDGEPDFIAINSAGTHLLRLLSDGAGGYTAPSNIYLGSGAIESFPMIYDTNDGFYQFAVITSSWMFVVRPDGVRSKVIASNGGGHIARVRQVPSGGIALPDCAAVLHNASGGGKQISVVDCRASLQTPVPLSGIDAASIFAGDVNADGSDDVGIGTLNTQVVYTYLNQRNAGLLTVDRFIAPYSRAISIASVVELGMNNGSTPVFADLNFDREADFFGIDANTPQALAIIAGAPTPPGYGTWKMEGTDSEHPCFLRGDFYSASYFIPSCGQPQPSDDGVLMLSIKNAWGVDPENLTDWHIELVMYEQYSTPSTLVPAPARRHLYDLWGSRGQAYRDAAPEGATWSLPVWIDQPDLVFARRYYIVLRLVPANENDEPLTEFQAGFVSEISNEDGDFTQGWLSYLTGFPGSWGISIPYDLHDEPDGKTCAMILGSRQATGGVVPLARLPRFPPGQPPTSGNLTEPPDPVNPDN